MKELFSVFNNNKDLCYLDSAASSLKPKYVVDKINDYYNNYSCNIDRGAYDLSMDATNICNESRKAIARFINANQNEIVFTRGASSSLNLVAQLVKQMLKPGDEVITSVLEHHSSFLPILNACNQIGVKVNFVELNERGEITVENFKKVLTDKTKFVELTHVSNVLGVTTPVKEICALAHSKGALVSIDGAQSVPHMKIDVKDLDCDFFSFSLHKMCGPTGLGVMYSKFEVMNKFNPIEFGGQMIDEVYIDHATYKDAPYKFETGTMPIAEIFGAKAAVEFIEKVGIENIEKISMDLRNKALKELSLIPELEIYNKDINTSMITFNVKGVHAHDVVTFLSDKVCVRAGHHCAENLHKYLNLNSTLRASFYFYNDEKDVEILVETIKSAIEFFKEVSLIG